MRQWKRYLTTGALGLALVASGCAARTGPIRGDASVEGDTTSARGRGQASSGTEQNTSNNTDRQGSGTTSGSGSLSGSGSGSGSLSGSGTTSQSGS
jgi:hypothetical protein